MPTAILNNPNWIRTAERLVGGHEVTDLPLDPTYTIASNPILPGYVAVAMNGVIRRADKDLDGGAFLGIFFSEFSSALDETLGLTIPPVVLRGPATMKIFTAALDSGSTYALSNTAVVELVAGDDGKLIPRGANTGPTVATLKKVLSDGIEIELAAPGQEVSE